jgi:hypothetical protein
MKALILGILAAAIALSVGCAAYTRFAGEYSRTYSLEYRNPDGAAISTGMTLTPLATPAPRPPFEF